LVGALVGVPILVLRTVGVSVGNGEGL